jgi:hypothetical protein
VKLLAFFFSTALVLGSLGLPAAIAASNCQQYGYEPDPGDSSYSGVNCLLHDVKVTDIPVTWNGHPGGLNVTDPSVRTNLSPFTWPKTWTDGREVPPGVKMAALLENEAILDASGNVSVTAGTLDEPYFSTDQGVFRASEPSIHMLNYSVLLQPKLIMNGASELHWRSPIAWDPTTYRHAYLNILDEAGHVVAAARYCPTGDASCVGSVSGVTVNPASDGLVDHGRLYYHLGMMLHSGQRYFVNEWVTLASGSATNMARVWIAQGQDIGMDGLTAFRFLPDTMGESVFNYQTTNTTMGMEAAWSALFYIGLSAGGAIDIAYASNALTNNFVTDPYVRAEAHDNVAEAGAGAYTHTQDADEAHVEIPLNLSDPVDIRVEVTPYASWDDRAVGDTAASSTAVTAHKVTGLLSVDIPLGNDLTWSSIGPHPVSVTTSSPANPFQAHYYKVDLWLNWAGASAPCGDAHLCYALYPTTQDTLPNGVSHITILTSSGGGANDIHVDHAGLWAYVTELHCACLGSTGTSHSIDSVTFTTGRVIKNIGEAMVLFGAGLGFFGLGLTSTIIGSPLGIPIAITGAGIAAVGVATAVVGDLLEAKGAQGEPLKVALPEALRDLGNGISHAAATAACVGTFIAPSELGKLAAGVACALLAEYASGGWDGLINFVVETIQTIEKSIDVLASLLATLLDLVAWVLTFIAPLVKFALVLAVTFTAVWLVRETILLVLNWLWLYVVSLSPKARAYFNAFENIVTGISVPFWDAWMKKHYQAVRGRYLRQNNTKGGNAE